MAGQVRHPANSSPFILCHLVDKINASAETIGKDGKFQVFVCGIKFVSDLRQVGGFLRFPSPIKLTATI
jgi:hypothetical protein